MNYDDLNTKLKKLYPVNKVSVGFQYWRRFLTEKCYGMFSYENLPENLPAEQIEMRLLLNGWAAIFKHKKYGLVTSFGGLSGVDMYFRPDRFVYAQPVLGSDNLKIDENCIIIYNAQIDQYEPQGLSSMIRRYARLLADIESSINIVSVNTRATRFAVANTQQVAKSVNEVMMKIQAGEFSTINQNTILDCFKTADFSDNRAGIVGELITARENLLKDFLSEIGVRSSTTKRERLVTDEVAADSQLLVVNTDDLLTWRKKGIDKVNSMFGTKISVNLSPAYEQDFTIGGNENDDI